MDIKKRFFNTCCPIALITAILIGISPTAHAAEELQRVNFKGIYSFGMLGMEFGQLGIETTQEDGKLAMASDIKSTGLMSVFVKHTSHTTYDVTGRGGIYESHYNTRKKARYVKMLTKNGVITEETLDPQDAPDSREPVPANLKKKAYNPLAYVLAMREWLYTAQETGTSKYSLLFYDGRRLTQGDFTVEGKRELTIDGKKYNVIAVSARRKQVAGFTKSEIAKHDPNEPTLWIYYSDDERLIPLRLEASLTFGTIAATLVKECGAGESCLLGNTE